MPTLAALLALALAPALAQAGDDWTQWRGPARDGHVPATSLPDPWPAELRRAWSVEVGHGHSSPVVGGGRAFTLTRRGEDEVVTAVDLATGAVLWADGETVEIGVNPYAKGHGRWPRSTPLLAGDRVVTLGAAGTLRVHAAADGEPLWRRALPDGVRTADLFCGTSASPLLHGGRIVVHLGDDSGGALVAFALADGAEAWRTPLEGPGYASPVAAELGGVAQLVTLTSSRVVGVALTDGALLWSVPFEDEWNENIVTPLVHGGRVLVAGVRHGISALEPRRGTDGWSVESVWRDQATTLYMSSPVLLDGLVVGFTQKRRGLLVGLDPDDGERLWELPEQAENAALLVAGERLLALTTAGELLVGRVDREGFAPEHRQELAEGPVWAHPAPLPDGLLVKEATTLTRWRDGTAEPAQR